MDFAAEVAIGKKRTVRDSLRAALSRLSSPVIIHKNAQAVVIKPSIFDPNLAGNTSLEMLRSVVRVFSGVAPICVVESDNHRRSASDAFAGFGVEAFEKDDVDFVNISSEELVAVPVEGSYFNEILVPEILLKNSFLVNLATAKCEPEKQTYTGCVKNLFGLIPEMEKRKYHEVLDNVLVDLLRVYKPQLNIVDLTEVVIGPRLEGAKHEVGGLVIGTSPLAVDAYCANLFGIDPNEVTYLRMAHELGFGEILPERIKVSGTNHQIEQLKKQSRIG